jgi:Tol biopolymer transport system component
MRRLLALAVLGGLVAITAVVSGDSRAGTGGVLEGAVTSAPAVAGVAGGGERSHGLYAFDASKRTLKQLIKDKAGEERIDLAWSPDGNWLASTFTDDFLVDVVRATGGSRRAVDSVSWSPDGSLVARATAEGLFIGPSSWSGARLVTRGRGIDVLDWARDGGQFVFGTDAGSCCWKSLGVAQSDGTGAAIVWAPPVSGSHDSWIDAAAWSPTGRLIAVAATINNAVEREGGGSFLYLVDTADQSARRLDDGIDGHFEGWSPDGQWLVLASDSSVYRVSADGGPPTSLCPQSCPDAVFSPDKRQFAFVTSSGVSGNTAALWLGQVDGSAARRIADVPKPLGIVWSPDSRKLGLTLPMPGGRHSRVAVVDVASGKLKQVTAGNEADFVVDVSTRPYVAFARARKGRAPELWVTGTNGTAATKVMTLATDPQLGSCALVAWAPRAAVLAITNEACTPS